MAKKKIAPLAATSGRDWRKPRVEGMTITLPSGNVVVCRPVQMDQLLAAGKIPDFLSPLVADLIWQTVALAKADAESDKNFIELLNIMAVASFVNPRIVDDPQADDEIALDDLEFSDKLAIYMIAKQPLAVLHRFRVTENPAMEPVQQGEDLQPPTE